MKKISIKELFVPIAIVLAGVIIAGAIVFVNSKQKTAAKPSGETTQNKTATEMRSVSVKDHILGNYNTAKVFLVEFSDLECPFCKNFHETMKSVIEEHGLSGNVAWVYRHFPLTSIHPKAIKEAEATECASELGGKIKFWQYVDSLFEVTPSNNGLDLSLLPEIAVDLGIDRKAFTLCLDSGKYAEKVNEDLKDALNSGGRGTPHTITITRDGRRAIPIQGAQSAEFVKAVINQLLNQ